MSPTGRLIRNQPGVYDRCYRRPDRRRSMDHVVEQGDVVSIARRAGEGTALDVLGCPYPIKAASAETGHRFCCIECAVPPGSGVPPHTHAHEDEAFYVLSGEIVL